MSVEEGSGQPPTAGADKAQPAKPAAAAFTSSFINKNTTGKKFAPKAARRRPGAAPPAPAPAPKSNAPEIEPAPPTVDAQTTATVPESSNAPSETAAPAQLPTPAATQEPITEHVPQATPQAPEAATAPTPTPAPSNQDPPATDEPFTATSPALQPAEVNQNEADTGRAVKRRRMEPPARQRLVVESSQPAQSEVEGEATECATQPADTDAPQPALEEAAASRPRKRRVLPWVAVNRPQQVQEEDEPVPAPATVPAKRTRKPPKPRGTENTAATAEEQEAGKGESVEDAEALPVQQRPSATGRSKRRANAAGEDDGSQAPTQGARARRPRKVKSSATVHDTDEEEAAGDAAEGHARGDGEPVARRPPKPRQPKRKRKAVTEGGTEGEQDAAQPKRKGRPPRESTPSDAEEQEIDPENTFMDTLASRNIRVGKLSAREKAMRAINWEDIKQRRREEDTRKVTSRAELEAAEKLQIEEAPAIEGPRYITIDGQIQVLQSSTTLNREADADREIENYEVVEERSLTTRITSRSFLKNNKRFPNDFILPGQGKRWSAADTELFYEGLQHFGTDFQMISHMFPGSTRRSIKLKFTREERDDPGRVREILLSRSTINTNWDGFIQASQMDEERFADADEIKRQLAEEEAEFRARIDAAKAETLERKRQQKEAGLLDDEDENGDPTNKENGKGKKKRKGKEKQVTFQEEAGVEILGNADDDATWGQE
ncbi:hypothetical protein HBI56_181980 [Parastagonospora nodorum]|uniref:Myb-like domain-containing protein n=2 Tax=Phaeosphaeria nodorum (strain SN15 / ATCC MYA-4574 / FGSC 10173) TaxID=321614 RepID=A0A7U2F902_PHANO|nr:hypothetical protein SNOG_16451 [Parastagonospora nodorum SN15]KAH3907753.1 hypothetical protein HBH56_187390 [Parastagonospora nodorum]EAT76149.1 hypothetical protein SNOG_16451 [Parastagonospora nodorum SN15]KAH3925240.1 hypothetical protein HBH54_181170 [Parastagonospora nodorum]KAH3959141.1 hypothetical protein HBH52_245910 [Parastagonospora nodorum]KAH3991079.1 hypothetical protein HBI10_238650 [Parastagonospora nodorum]